MDPNGIGTLDAKRRLTELLAQVRRGPTYRITWRGKAVAELRPIATAGTPPILCADRGRTEIADDFDAPVPDLKAYR